MRSYNELNAYNKENATDEKIHETQKLEKTGWRLTVGEKRAVKSRMGRRICPPAICKPKKIASSTSCAVSSVS